MTQSVAVKSTLSNGSPSRRNQSEKISRVLLVCVYDTIVFEITNDLIYDRFQEFGHILRILIFQRKQVTKLFVEFNTCEQASKAKQSLDGKKLYNSICKMSIYFSNFENVDLKHQTSQGMDFYSGANYDQLCNNQSQDNFSMNSGSDKSPTKKLDDFDQFSAFGINGVHRLGALHVPGDHTYLQRSKTANNEMQWHINRVQKQNNIWGGVFDIDDTIKSDIDSILNCEIEKTDKLSFNSSTFQTPKKSPKIKTQQGKEEPLPVLGFRIKNAVKHFQIYNLFSNFGNISMITVKRNQIRVKFRTADFAAIAKNYLNNTWLFENKMQMNSLPSSSCYPDEGQYAQLICYDEVADRFTQKKSITINPPSKTLHVSGMKKQKCTIAEINNMFKHVVEPNKIKILKQNSDKNMALVEFNCLEDSFDVVAQCHNMMVGGRKIQISFTKSQI